MSDNKDAAEAKKAEANKFFAEKQYSKAIALYTEAIELDGLNAVYYSNRAFAHLKLEEYGSCLDDANASININPKYVKAYYRRGSALLALGRFKEGLKDFKAVVKIVPKDKDARAKLKACEQVLKRMAFENAICSNAPEAEPTCETIDTSTIVVDDKYSGPRISESGVTSEFCTHLMEYQRDQNKLHRKYVMDILIGAYNLFKESTTVQDISLPPSNKFTVCGDVHGQYYDLLNIFKLNGVPSRDNPYLFNGDFVDRGSFSVEVILLMLSFKLADPLSIFLSRGNHETMNMNKMFGFDGEVKAKYNDTILQMFREVFIWLPLCALIENKVFVCHGGLFSQDGVTLDQIRQIKRNCEPPDQGLMTELLWSDPWDQAGRGPSKRGVGVQFGYDVTNNFLETNALELVIRSHECRPEGYLEDHNGKCITVFSAPNYCDQLGNKGAFIVFDKTMKPQYTSFKEVPHPDIKPMAYVEGMPSLFS